MRKLLTILFLFCFSATFAQITIVSTGSNAGNGSTAAVPSSNTTGAKIIVIQVAVYAGVTTGNLIDNKSNTYTLLRTDQVSGSVALLTYYCASPNVGAGHTMTYNKTGSYPAINMIALGNVPTTSPIDQQAGSFIASGSSISPGSITPGSNNEIVISGMAAAATTTTPTINGGFTISGSVPFGSGVNQCGMMAYLIQTTATAANPAWIRALPLFLPWSISFLVHTDNVP